MTPLEHLSHPLLKVDQDFSAAFMMVNGIRDGLKEASWAPGKTLLAICERMMSAPAYRKQKQAYFLYHATTEILRKIMTRPASEDSALRGRAMDLLLSGLSSPYESLRRASAEGLGMLPLAVDNTLPPEPEDDTCMPGSLPQFNDSWLAARNIQMADGWSWAGRSLRAKTRSGDLLVVKCLRKGEDPETLQRELAWMRHLEQVACSIAHRFEIPKPLEHHEGWLVRLPRAPHTVPAGVGLHPKRYAVAFLASPDYFRYPNEAVPDRRLTGRQICEVLSRNAWLMGHLMAMGIAHTAPIPLFHNRAQRHRREDGGRYRWTHRGRLDRWLASCRHPNFGMSGLRDFEHFSAVAGQYRSRYEAIGSHLISLLLVAGSYFRQKAPERVGFDAAGRPADARCLFDRDLLKRMVGEVWQAYVEGFTGGHKTDGAPVALDLLIDRMIEEMGVDRHMEEILRVVDQEAMSRAMFLSFLQSRGFSLPEAQRLLKGKADIPLITGPHLGGFNQPISLPELIDFAAAGAAHCVAERFRKENALVNG